jgi:hypothetical protein
LAFEITLHGLHATETKKVMGLAGSASEPGGSPCFFGQLTLVFNDLFTTTGYTGYTALGNNNEITAF